MRLLLAAMAVLLAVPVQAGPTGRVEVIDGDTIRVGGETVRLFGIDAPERDQLCWEEDGDAVRCGEWASWELARLVEGAFVNCDAMRVLRGGRILATCNDEDGFDIGESALKAGIVFVYSGETHPDYLEFEKEAELLGRGLWNWDHEDPREFRARMRTPEPRQEAPREGCEIKGNISGNGQIYHLPGQQDYDATRINTSKGERWFCTEAEARAAGWRRAKR